MPFLLLPVKLGAGLGEPALMQGIGGQEPGVGGDPFLALGICTNASQQVSSGRRLHHMPHRCDPSRTTARPMCCRASEKCRGDFRDNLPAADYL